ncbi:MAG TPA: mechanosensitive ion channel family protein [Thiothrix sp.]|nr:mechanosensitive ion channel family protein [Thiothrix sp.]
MDTSINQHLFQPVIQAFAGHPIMQGGAVILITVMLASTLTWIIYILLKQITRRTNTYLDDRLLNVARGPIYYSLMMLGMSTGIRLMQLSPKFTEFSMLSFKTLGVVIWTLFFIKVAKILIKQLAWLSDRHQIIQPQTIPLFDNFSKVIIIVIALYITFDIWTIDMTAWLASAGVIGIAIGFAAKDSLANLFSGAFILADAPYKINDYIVLDDGTRGKVTHIGLRSTRLLTRDDVEITIPNSIIGNSQITNQSGGPHRKFRLRVAIGVAYGSDLDHVQTVLLDLANTDPYLCEKPTPRLRLRQFGASSLDYELLCWVDDPERRGIALDSINTRIYKRFAQENIEIPYTKQDVYIKEFPNTLDAPFSELTKQQQQSATLEKTTQAPFAELEKSTQTQRASLQVSNQHQDTKQDAKSAQLEAGLETALAQQHPPPPLINKSHNKYRTILHSNNDNDYHVSL